MNKRLERNEFLAGANYSIADIASVGWTRGWDRMGQDIADFPHLKRWLDQLLERPAVQEGLAVAVEARRNLADDKEAQKSASSASARVEGARAHALSANSSRPISMRRISLVPAPIS